jgi:kynureninase
MTVIANISSAPIAGVDFAALRTEFAIPQIPREDGKSLHYFCGNSLGLMPKAARAMVLEALDAWAADGVEGHFKGAAPWMSYHQLVRDDLARLVGAKAIEVVAMNTLTVNLHLLMTSFFRPNAERNVILMEARAFPSDRHALESQLKLHGLDANTCLIELAPEPGSDVLQPDAIDAAIQSIGERLSVVLMPGVQYATGQAFDITRITQAAHAVGAIAGFDLAHAVGNLVLNLHDANADFAVWCSYKYLNSGPGAVAGAFVHERHALSNRPRLAGWWGSNADTRFQMGPDFAPTPGAEGWQLSNPPIFSLAPLRASLAQFTRVGMPTLRARSLQLTGYLSDKITAELSDFIQIITPADPAQRGCQLSMRVLQGAIAGRACHSALGGANIIADWREPDVIRVAPAPMYNTLDDIDCLIAALHTHFNRVPR